MTLVALCEAPGTSASTTSALALAALAPEGRPTIVLECDPSGGDPGSATGTLLRSETILSLVNLSADGPTDLAPGEMRTITGQVRAEIWDVWQVDGSEERRFNYATDGSWEPVRMELESGDGGRGPAEAVLVARGELADEALERGLAHEQVGRLLELLDLAERHGARAPAELLRAGGLDGLGLLARLLRRALAGRGSAGVR